MNSALNPLFNPNIQARIEEEVQRRVQLQLKHSQNLQNTVERDENDTAIAIPPVSFESKTSALTLICNPFRCQEKSLSLDIPPTAKILIVGVQQASHWRHVLGSLI